MKISTFLFKSLPHWLVLPVFILGSLFTAPTARAASPCSLLLVHSGTISADETWCDNADGVHYLSGDVTVQAGVTLTIAAGVTVDSLEADWSKYLIIQGHLDINGTSAQPVLLTRSINYPNQNWSGLYFDGSQGDGSGTLNYAIIDHAGSNFLPSGCVGVCGTAQTAVFVKDLTPGKQVTISNSTIHNNTSKGLFVVDSSVNVTHTTFSQNKYPIWIEGSQSVVTYSANTFTSNAYPYYDNINYTIQEDSIFIGPDALMGQDFNLPAQSGLDAYVFLSGTTLPFGRSMTVDPGVTLRMTGDGYLVNQGHLNAVGTSALPIRFSGIPGSNSGVSLYWGGLFFDGSQGDGSGKVNYAIIDHAGSNFLPSGCAGACGTAQTGILVKDIPTDKLLTISNSTIQDSLSKGLYLVNSPSVHFDNNLIAGGRFGAYFVSDITVSNLALTDQELDGVIVENGFHVDARHLTIARAGRSGFHVSAGGTGDLRNSILSNNKLAVWAEGSGLANLDTNLADANTTFKNGSGTDLNTINAFAEFEPDGYHIQTTSDAVGMGLTGLSTVDIDGDARPGPAASRPDLGADEVPTGKFIQFLPIVIR